MFIYADQTPTPTRFLKNCEEVGLFNELASSFEQELSKAHEDEHRTKHPVRKKMSKLLKITYFWVFPTSKQVLICFQYFLFKAAPLQTPSEVKIENEGPLQVDSSPPDSPDSSSSMSDDSRDSRVRAFFRASARVFQSIHVKYQQNNKLCCVFLTGNSLKASGKLSPHSNYCASGFSPPALKQWCSSSNTALSNICDHTSSALQQTTQVKMQPVPVCVCLYQFAQSLCWMC